MSAELRIRIWFGVVLFSTILGSWFSSHEFQEYAIELDERITAVEKSPGVPNMLRRVPEVTVTKLPRPDDELVIGRRYAPLNAVVLESNVMHRGESCWLAFEHVRLIVLTIKHGWVRLKFERRSPTSTSARSSACRGDTGTLAVPISVYALYQVDAAIAAEREAEEGVLAADALSLFPASVSL